MLRAALLFSGLLTLGVAAALYFGMLPVDTAQLRALVNAVPGVAAPAALSARATSPVPVSIAKALR